MRKLVVAFILSTGLAHSAAETRWRVIGHRGAAGYAPENTLVAFEKARLMGVYDVELDIQLSKDLKLVLFHDSTLDTKTQLKGKVRDFNWEDLQKAEIGTWFDETKVQPDQKFAGTTINLLEDLFEKYRNHFYYHVEIKAEDPEIPALALGILNKFNLSKSSEITSFYREQLIAVRQLDPKIKLCQLIDEKKNPDIKKTIQEAKALGFNGVAIRAPMIERSHISLADHLGIEIRLWGIKSGEDMHHGLELGLGAMTIDYPHLLINELLKTIR